MNGDGNDKRLLSARNDLSCGRATITMRASANDLRACAAAFSPRDPVARWARGLRLAHAFAAGLLGVWVAPHAPVDGAAPFVETRADSGENPPSGKRSEARARSGERRLRTTDLMIESDLPTFTALAGWERELLLPFVGRLVDDGLDDVEEKG